MESCHLPVAPLLALYGHLALPPAVSCCVITVKWLLTCIRLDHLYFLGERVEMEWVNQLVQWMAYIPGTTRHYMYLFLASGSGG